MEEVYLKSSIDRFRYYKMLGDKTLSQLNDEALFFQYNEASNSIAVIVKHMWGNMLSRWTDFLTTDGEKTWRNRDTEFEAGIDSREALMQKWEEGWTCLFEALEDLSISDLKERTVLIRNEPHAVAEAINRQIAHYAYHVGQIVFLGKMLSKGWQSLSIPKGGSKAFNEKMNHRV